MTEGSRSLLDTGAISRLRVDARMSIRRLAELVGVSQTTIRGIEQGRNHETLVLEMVGRLAAALETTPQALFGDVPDETPPMGDDVAVEAALGMLGRAVPINELARALDWPLERTRAALQRAAVRLRGSGHALVDAGWQKSRLVPASHTLTEDQQLALQQIAPRQRGLSVTAARVLRTFIAGSLDAAWHQHASGADRAALAELLKQGVLRIVDDGNRSTLVLSDACAYLDPGVRRPDVLDPRPYVDGSMRR